MHHLPFVPLPVDGHWGHFSFLPVTCGAATLSSEIAESWRSCYVSIFLKEHAYCFPYHVLVHIPSICVNGFSSLTALAVLSVFTVAKLLKLEWGAILLWILWAFSSLLVTRSILTYTLKPSVCLLLRNVRFHFVPVFKLNYLFVLLWWFYLLVSNISPVLSSLEMIVSWLALRVHLT